jgi:MoxR-like ATPase
LPDVDKILAPDAILRFQDLVLRVPVADPVVELAVRIARQTRPENEGAPAEVKEFVSYGAGPRATQHLVLAAKARAILDGRPVVDASDVRALAKPVLRHRILTNFHAEARKVTSDDLIARVIEATRQ